MAEQDRAVAFEASRDPQPSRGSGFSSRSRRKARAVDRRSLSRSANRSKAYRTALRAFSGAFRAQRSGSDASGRGVGTISGRIDVLWRRESDGGPSALSQVDGISYPRNEQPETIGHAISSGCTLKPSGKYRNSCPKTKDPVRLRPNSGQSLQAEQAGKAQ